MSNRPRVRQEAEERYPFRKGHTNSGAVMMINCRTGFMAGRTVTAEQIEQAEDVVEELDGADIADVVRAAFTAAGFIVPEEA